MRYGTSYALLLIFGVGISAGCSTAEKNVDDDFSLRMRETPKEWPALSLERVADTGCSNISGLYQTKGESIIFRGVDRETKGVLSSFIVNRHPRSSEKIETERKGFPQVTPQRFEIRQESEFFLVATDNWKTNNVGAVEFSRLKGDYVCKDGWIILPRMKHGGASEGASTKTEANIRIAKLVDGSIIYHEHFRLRVSGFFTSSDTQTETYYRFGKSEITASSLTH